MVITLMAVTLVPASTEDGEDSLVVLEEMIFMLVYLLVVVSVDGIGRIVPSYNGGDGTFGMLLVSANSLKEKSLCPSESVALEGRACFCPLSSKKKPCL